MFLTETTGFERISDEVYLLKIPFGPVWTGVTLIDGREKILIDSGAASADVDGILVPALQALGVDLADVAYLVNTHSHGDHIGGHARLRELGGFRVAAFEKAAPKVADPVPYAIATRTRFPADSPAPVSSLRGVPVDVVLRDGDVIGDSLRVIHTPGHDDDCVCFLHLKTGTLITGDSLQANGTICQGIGFYKSLPDYRAALKRLSDLPVETILCGHDYDGIGYLVRGREAVRAALAYCRERVEIYGAFVAANKDLPPREIARELIRRHGCGMPDKLFMALYTVTEHLNELEKEQKNNG